jgi:NDP-sugar pyrophosphorylase family protein
MKVIKSSKIPSDTEVLLLCGGAGTRLREVVKNRPKPPADINDINGRSFLDIIIDFFSQQGLKMIENYILQ